MTPDVSERSDPALSQEELEPAKASTLARVVFVGSVAVLLVALVAAVAFGARWGYSASTSDSRGDARDAALNGARQAVLNLMAMDADDVPGSLELARSSMTGALLEHTNEIADQLEEQAQREGDWTSKVLSGALISLDSEQNSASTLLVVQQTGSDEAQAPIVQIHTLAVDVIKDGEVWKAEQIAVVGTPISASAGPSAGSPPAPAVDEPPAVPEPGP
ncbi:hypothetical protein [Nocardia sp. CNY236]|uniref:hypothetical protein n=1 Tax=Nocardia sp. CNY236 TaxID=1169152 RepID=UPI0003FD7DF4|nr:hypothetical protein [Nocardia sp. CNY236]